MKNNTPNFKKTNSEITKDDKEIKIEIDKERKVRKMNNLEKNNIKEDKALVDKVMKQMKKEMEDFGLDVNNLDKDKLDEYIENMIKNDPIIELAKEGEETDMNNLRSDNSKEDKEFIEKAMMRMKKEMEEFGLDVDNLDKDKLDKYIENMIKNDPIIELAKEGEETDMNNLRSDNSKEDKEFVEKAMMRMKKEIEEFGLDLDNLDRDKLDEYIESQVKDDPIIKLAE